MFAHNPSGIVNFLTLKRDQKTICNKHYNDDGLWTKEISSD